MTHFLCFSTSWKASQPSFSCFILLFEALPNKVKDGGTHSSLAWIPATTVSTFSSSFSLLFSLYFYSLCLFTVKSSRCLSYIPPTLQTSTPLCHSSVHKHTTIFALQYVKLWIAKQVEKWDIRQQDRLIRNIYSSHSEHSFQILHTGMCWGETERGKINVNLKIRKALIFH